jgi:hypothetical protein
MEQIVSATTSDDKSTAMTSSVKIERPSKVSDDERQQRERKTRHYESECTRYGLPVINAIRRFMLGEASGVDHLNLDFYGLTTLQCQIMFDAMVMRPITPLTVVSLKDNDLEHFCCPSIAAFLRTSVSLTDLTLEGCK